MSEQRIDPVLVEKTAETYRELLRELAEDAMNPVFEDSRVKYVEIQIDRDTWESLKRIYEGGSDA